METKNTGGVKGSASTPPPSRKPVTSGAPRMLTESEIESLQRDAAEAVKVARRMRAQEKARL